MLKPRDMLSSAEGGTGGEATLLGVSARKREFVERFLAASDAKNDVAAVRRVIMDAMTTASISSRAPSNDNPRGWSYALLPDHAVRLTAARLLAEVYGLIGVRESLTLNLADNRMSVSVGQRVSELVSVGVPPEVIFADLRRVLADAEAAQPQSQAALQPAAGDAPA